MSLFNPKEWRNKKREWKAKNREKEIELKINTVLSSVLNDTNDFNSQEQAFIVKTVQDRFKAIKSKERQNALDLANEITESLKQLK
jgi:hypothetical protein